MTRDFLQTNARRDFLKTSALTSALLASMLPFSSSLASANSAESSTAYLIAQKHLVGNLQGFSANKVLMLENDIRWQELREAFASGGLITALGDKSLCVVLSALARDYQRRVVFSDYSKQAQLMIFAPKGVRI